ncbi:Chaperone protein DnaJ [Durusdinium trenchii]|uniref:Chaperone protein DnaJ n=1 Tax=Durusdinium trenchii TaxID=1381693 RepID=A0ABP0KSR3_9DINO
MLFAGDGGTGSHLHIDRKPLLQFCHVLHGRKFFTVAPNGGRPPGAVVPWRCASPEVQLSTSTSGVEVEEYLVQPEVSVAVLRPGDDLMLFLGQSCHAGSNGAGEVCVSLFHGMQPVSYMLQGSQVTGFLGRSPDHQSPKLMVEKFYMCHPRPRPLFFRFRAHLVKELKDLEQLKPQKFAFGKHCLLRNCSRSAATPGAGYVNYASGIGSQAFRSNLAAQNIPQKSDLPQWPRSDIPRRVPDPPAARSSPAPKAAPPQVVAAFRALLLDPTAKEEEVKKSFRRLAKQYHPDKQAEGVDLEVAKERFQRIKTAYETCMDFLEV